MRQRLLFLTTLVPLVLAPRPPEEPGSGSHPRLGKSQGSKLATAGPGSLEARAGTPGALGTGSWATVASLQVFSVGRGCGSGFSERRELGWSLREEGSPGRGLTWDRDRGPGRGQVA